MLDGAVKLSAAVVACSLVLALAFWYVLYIIGGERPAPEETAVLVGIALALVGGGAAVRARLRRAGEKKRQ